MGWYRPTVKHPRRFSVIFQNPTLIDRFSSSPGPVVEMEETMRAKHSLTYLVMCLGWMLPITTVHSSQLIFWKDTRPWALSLSPCEYAPPWVVAKLPDSLSSAREQLAEWVGSRQLIFWALPCPHILWLPRKQQLQPPVEIPQGHSLPLVMGKGMPGEWPTSPAPRCLAKVCEYQCKSWGSAAVTVLLTDSTTSLSFCCPWKQAELLMRR